MTAERWMKMQRNVSLASYAMIALFWLVNCWPDLWWFGLLMAAYQGQGFLEGWKADMADERAELIAARAGFLSQKLMVGAAILVLALDRKHRLNGAWPLIAVLLVGAFSETAFRKWLGAEPRGQGSWRLLGVIVAIVTLAFAIGLAYVFWRL